MAAIFSTLNNTHGNVPLPVIRVSEEEMQEGKEIQESLKMEKEEQIPKKEVQKEHKIQEQVQGG